MKPNIQRWYAVDFNGRFASVWMEDSKGQTSALRFRNLADFSKLVYTLQGALHVAKREAREAKTRKAKA